MAALSLGAWLVAIDKSVGGYSLIASAVIGGLGTAFYAHQQKNKRTLPEPKSKEKKQED